MHVPSLHGLIRRRVLVNFRVNPEVMAKLLPQPFTPKLHNGWAMAGICLIRLERVRPALLPGFVGFTSENAAHRIAVRWLDKENQHCEGVYIPRRHTNSKFIQFAGGRLFPGEHEEATIAVTDQVQSLELHLRARDDSLSIDLSGTDADNLPPTSIFSSLTEASEFFRAGSLGYSETKTGKRLDGVRLLTRTWQVKPLAVKSVHSSYFENLKLFPQGSVEFDCALVMRNMEHEWQMIPSLEIGTSSSCEVNNLA
jgi:hypothetical protein